MTKFEVVLKALLLTAMLLLIAGQVSACELQAGSWTIMIGPEDGCLGPLSAGSPTEQTISGFDVEAYGAIVDLFNVGMYVQQPGATDSFSEHDFGQLAVDFMSNDISFDKKPTILSYNGRDWAMVSGTAMGAQAWAACTMLDDQTIVDFVVWERQLLEDNIKGFQAEQTKESQQSESGGFGRDQYDPEFDPNYKPNGQTGQGKVQQSGGLGQALEDL